MFCMLKVARYEALRVLDTNVPRARLLLMPGEFVRSNRTTRQENLMAPIALLYTWYAQRNARAQAPIARPHLWWALLPLVASLCTFACGSEPGDVRSARVQQSLATPVYQINSGGPATGSFAADQYSNGGATFSTSNAVSTVGVANAAPAAVYQSERYGDDYSYIFGNLNVGSSYTVRLHFAEIWNTQPGTRVFNVAINGIQVLTNLDIFARVGGYKALVQDFTATASSGGQIVIRYVNVVGGAKSSGVEILSGSAAVNQSPTVATPAAATPSTVTGTTSSLSALGADDGGEAQLTYTWSVTGSPQGVVSFSANASNAAKNTVVTFTKAGSYALLVKITDAAGASTTSVVNVVVNQTLTNIAVSPSAVMIQSGATQSFTATATDQFGIVMAPQPTFTWATTGGGRIDSSGLFSASVVGGPFTVVASSGSQSGSTSVTVTQTPALQGSGTATYQINCGGPASSPFAADQFSNGGGTFASSTTVSTAGVANAAPASVYQSERYGDDYSYVFGSLTANSSYTVRLHFAEIWNTQPGARVFNVSINGTQLLTNFDIFAQVGGNKALVRDFSATASSSGQITIRYVNVVGGAKSSGIEILSSAAAPSQTLASINVTPASAQVAVNAKQQFTATALDQSGNPMSSQPAFTWSVSGGGSIDSSGMFTATSAGAFTVSVAGGGKTGAASIAVTAAQSGPFAGDVAVNPADVHQRIDGFGAADTNVTLTDLEADLFFSQSNGIGLSTLRVEVSATGQDAQTYANAQKAAARGAKVWASTWSPPAAWKDNNSTTNGGHLLLAHYDDWANVLAGFASTMQQHGVALYGISAQNEPDYTATWNSCLYSSDQMVAFIKVLGPKLAAISPRPKLIAPEVSNWGNLWSYGDAILQDATASSFTDIIATHDYTYATPTHAAIPQPIWETEVSTFDAFSGDMGNGLMVAEWVHRALVTGSVSAWHYWWLISDDNQGLLGVGDVVTKRYFALGNFSKFVRPGYERVGLTGPMPSGVDVSAYLDPASGALVVVAINENSGATPVSFYLPGSHTGATPWVTSASDNLAVKNALAVSAGHFSTSLPGQSVTTFVAP